MSTLPTPVQHNLRNLSLGSKMSEGDKRDKMEKEEVKVSLLAADAIVSLKDPKDSTRKLLQPQKEIYH